MFLSSARIAEVIVILTVIVLGLILFYHKIGKSSIRIGFFLVAWFGVFSVYLAGEITTLNERVKITAIQQKNEASLGTQVHIFGYSIDGEELGLTHPVEGNWAWYKKGKNSVEYMCSWFPGDERHPDDATDYIVLELPVGRNRKVNFITTTYSGFAKIEINKESQIIDTWGMVNVISAQIADSTEDLIEKNQWAQFPYFTAIFLLLSTILYSLVFFSIRNDRMKKIEKYHFLFSELVKRDFTLKYKRTMLGMFWSMLSPLINLLIMWLVFDKILANNVNHFVIYLFAGQLVFSFFSEASNLGMTSLLENASIFTKINVPKYLFLLSKNVSSLINFGLNMVIFFIFVAFEGITFTAKYILLIYPIGCLIVFNIGLGLILSALYVFFRDMQYLWGLFSQLIMWISAIFYSIQNFSITTQNMFLLNPIYLFIRYFRKIVIESSVPSVGFHIMMAGYAMIFFGIGCWMYKKYNHEFLYYI